LQRRRARGRHHDAMDAEALLQEAATLLGKVSITADITERDRLADVIQFLANNEGFVEGNEVGHGSPGGIKSSAVTRMMQSADRMLSPPGSDFKKWPCWLGEYWWSLIADLCPRLPNQLAHTV